MHIIIKDASVLYVIQLGKYVVEVLERLKWRTNHTNINQYLFKQKITVFVDMVCV